MKMKEIVKKADGMGVSPIKGLEKLDLIHAIQEKEGNAPCYATAFGGRCDRKNCLWYADCMEDSQTIDV